MLRTYSWQAAYVFIKLLIVSPNFVINDGSSKVHLEHIIEALLMRYVCLMDLLC